MEDENRSGIPLGRSDPPAKRPILPDFLLIGAAKAGTTSLWNYLVQHPDVYLPRHRKEPNYFAFPDGLPPCVGPASPRDLHELLYKFSVTSWPEYLQLFESAGQARAVGEASVRYLYEPEAPARIHERLPDVRLIAVLREPVARLYSHYCMNRQFQLEPLPLEAAIEAEPERRRLGWGYDWHYVAVGRYAEQIQRYFDRFGRERVAVHLYDDFREDPMLVYRDICRFLEIDPSFEPDVSERHKEAYLPRHLALDRFLHHPHRARTLLRRLLPSSAFARLHAGLLDWNAAPVPPLAKERSRALKPHFREDVLRLQELLGRDLSRWL